MLNEPMYSGKGSSLLQQNLKDGEKHEDGRVYIYRHGKYCRMVLVVWSLYLAHI